MRITTSTLLITATASVLLVLVVACCLLIGEHFLAADQGGRTRAEVLARAADLLLDRK